MRIYISYTGSQSIVFIKLQKFIASRCSYIKSSRDLSSPPPPPKNLNLTDFLTYNASVYMLHEILFLPLHKKLQETKFLEKFGNIADFLYIYSVYAPNVPSSFIARNIGNRGNKVYLLNKLAGRFSLYQYNLVQYVLQHIV